MANFFTDNDDLRFYFDQGVPWAELVELTEYGFRAPDGFKDVEEAKSFYRDVAESFGELAAEGNGAQIELRASWTPGAGDLSKHVEAWAELLCMLGGLPPGSENVAVFGAKRGPRG